MAKRPSVFELDTVESELREQGVPEDSIGPTISFMRLVIPLAIERIGEDGIIDVLESAKAEWGIEKQSGWATTMSQYVVAWARNNVEKYKAEPFELPSA